MSTSKNLLDDRNSSVLNDTIVSSSCKALDVSDLTHENESTKSSTEHSSTQCNTKEGTDSTNCRNSTTTTSSTRE